LTPATAPHSVRRLYRPSSVPVNLQQTHLLAPPPLMTSLEHSASATDDEEQGMTMTSLRRGSDILKMSSSNVIQAAATSTVRTASTSLTAITPAFDEKNW